LPAQHPIYELLRPHFTGTIQINAAARTRLIAPGGPIDESIAVGSEGALTLLARTTAQWSFEQFDPIRGLEVEHAAVKNGQYAQFGYIPNTPGALYLPPPEDHQARSEANFVYALPPFRAVGQQLRLVAMLSEKTPTPLGAYPEDFFQGGPEALVVIDRFRDDLAQAGVDIAARNRTLDVPYRYLQPHLVGRSIAI
jgi:hypothetical protein